MIALIPSGRKHEACRGKSQIIIGTIRRHFLRKIFANASAADQILPISSGRSTPAGEQGTGELWQPAELEGSLRRLGRRVTDSTKIKPRPLQYAEKNRACEEALHNLPM